MKKYMFIFFISVFGLSLFAQETPLWLRYPTISPDGKTVVFSYKGDLWKVSTNGGTATAITQNDAYDFKPVWSPDGKTIAFASDRYGNFDIFTISANGGVPKRLTYYSGREVPNSFTPDGSKILFKATIEDPEQNVSFPRSYLSELYEVSVNGGTIKQILSTPAEEAKYSTDKSKIIFQDAKGPENYWRKHHTSSITRDVWVYDTNNKVFNKLTNFKGEDRLPSFSADEKYVYYTSEQFDNTFNVCKFELSNPKNIKQITKFKKNPVRFLTVSKNNDLCFTYDGEIYTMKEGQEPKKLKITIYSDLKENPEEYVTASSGITDMAVSPDGKEIAFIVRGNVFVTSVNYSTTKQITSTPEQERSLSFSPDGKSILYASERNDSWNVYQTKIVNKDEDNFIFATELKEEPLLTSKEEEFQPSYSPDGKEVAYLENRTTLRVLNLETKKIRTVLDGNYNYSYSDGDQDYKWSPDSKYFLVSYSPNTLFSNDIGLVKADGSEQPENLTLSGYSDGNPKWVLKGKGMIWESDRNGYRSHGSWGSYRDVYAMFFTQDAYDKFRLTEEEYNFLKEKDKKKDKKDDANNSDKKKSKKKKDTDKKDKKETTEPVEIDKAGLEDRIARLTINSSSISDMVLSPEGDKLYYLTRFEKGFDLWVNDLRKHQTKLAKKLSGYGGNLIIDKKGENLFLFSDGQMIKIKTSDFSKKTVSFKAEYYLNKTAERSYMFNHVWRQMYEKFYKKDMQGVDWAYYKTVYAKFLPYISNNYDFAEMLSEMLGELNASHTGSGYRHRDKTGDKTASLGIIYDINYTGKGIKITEVIDKSPMLRTEHQIKPGFIIEEIDNQPVTDNQTYFKLLNHKADKDVLLKIKDVAANKTYIERVRAISLREENDLLYERWVKNRRAEVEKLSGGRLGYVHVRGMNSPSFRKVYSDLLGKEYHKEAVIIDTRFNHGGWLHDDLATLFGGKKYITFSPRGHKFGYDPLGKWVKPSVLLMSEGNYSDGYGFPYAYTALKIGKTVGMPIPGTMTAVWWETLQDKTLYFGIPQVGALDMTGEYLENKQLEPDYKIQNDYNVLINGRDQQLEKAVEVMLKELGDKK